MKSAIDVARPYVGEKETGGPNRSPFIDRLCEQFGVPLGSSWCALLVSKCFEDAGAGSGFPYSASSQQIRRWFEAKGRLSRDPDDLLNGRER